MYVNFPYYKTREFQPVCIKSSPLLHHEPPHSTHNTLELRLNTGCIKMIGAVWKLIIFTSMVKRLINTSRNERVTLQVYDTRTQMCDFFGLRRKDCLTRSTFSSDTRPSCTFSFTKAPCCLKLLIPASNAIGRWGDHC